MKKFILICSLFLISCTSPVFARDIVIALPPSSQNYMKRPEIKDVIKFLTTLEAGTTAHLVDGYNIKTIGTFTVPTDSRYTSLKARVIYNKKPLAALKNFYTVAKYNGDTLHLPKVLRHVATIPHDGGGLDVIVIGSGLHKNFDDYPFTMNRFIVPSDGHINAARSASVYGTSGMENTLNNIRVHYVLDGSGIFHRDSHRYFVHRFWTLFIEAQGGELVSYSDDLANVFARVKANSPAPSHDFILENTDKIEMINFISSSSRLFNAPLADKGSNKNISLFSDRVEVGISWDCTRCDLDLYARLNGKDGAPVSFKNHITDWGAHTKETRSNPNGLNGFETIRMRKAINLNDLTLGIHFYAGQSETPITGELRIKIEKHVYAFPFTIKAKQGNGAAEMLPHLKAGISDNPHILILKPAALLAKH